MMADFCPLFSTYVLAHVSYVISFALRRSHRIVAQCWGARERAVFSRKFLCFAFQGH